jgi:hypothetical protein
MLDDEYLREAERRARVFQGAWTGTSGTLAADVIRLIHYVRELRRDHDRRGTARNGEGNDHRTPDYLRPRD